MTDDSSIPAGGDLPGGAPRASAGCAGPPPGGLLGPHRTGVLPFPPLTGYWINRLGAAFRTAVDRELKAHDLTRQQVATLAHVRQGLASSASDLTRAMCVDSTAVTRMLDRLEEKNLVRRVQDPEDGRRQLIELTETAEALMPRITAIARSVEGRFESDVTDDDLTTFHRVLVKMLENAGEALVPKLVPGEEFDR
ncbi:MAG: MarR family transcriptional regulator [Planctomycetota bacterium]